MKNYYFTSFCLYCQSRVLFRSIGVAFLAKIRVSNSLNALLINNVGLHATWLGLERLLSQKCLKRVSHFRLNCDRCFLTSLILWDSARAVVFRKEFSRSNSSASPSIPIQTLPNNTEWKLSTLSDPNYFSHHLKTPSEAETS